MVLLGSKQVITTDDGTTLDWAQNLLQKDHHDHGATEEEYYYFPKAPSTGTSTSTGRDHNQLGPTINITINSSSTDHERCPRCDSRNTKFCYYNNYNRSQPRHLCKTCRRHWTKGGTLRNVPIGGARTRGRKKNTTTTSNLKQQQQQRRRLIKPTTTTTASASTTTTTTSSHCSSYLPLIFSRDQDHQMKTQLQYSNNLQIETSTTTTTTSAAHENFLVINNNDDDDFPPAPPPPSLPHPTTTMPDNFFPPLDEYPPVSINDDIVTSYNYQLINDVDDDHRSIFLPTSDDLQYYYCSDDSDNFIEYYMTSTGHL